MQGRLAIAMAVGLGLAAGDACAVALNPRGVGQVLIYPYFTVNGGQSTAFSIINSTAVGKAVKLRFLESRDGRSVFDANVYLGPYDVFEGQLVPYTDDGQGAALFSGDNSCTVPALPTSAATATPFRTYAFDGTPGYPVTDGGPTDITRTQEGWIEVIEMGEVTNATQHTLDAISHVSGVPRSCAQVVAAWDTGGYWRGDPTVDLAPPGGGLFGNGLIVNVSLGTVEGYPATALSQFYTQGSAPAHTAPGATTPNLGSGNSLTASLFVGDSPLTITMAFSIDAVSAVLMATRVTGEFWNQASIGASTEWVMTFPTKPFYTDPQYVGKYALNPFDEAFHDMGASVSGSCSQHKPDYHGRDTPTSDTGTNFAPRPNTATFTCNAAQVLGFSANATSQVLHANAYVRASSTMFTSGWYQLDWAPPGQSESRYIHSLQSAGDDTVYGQPMIGLQVTQFVNGALSNGTLSNYTMATPLQTALDCDRGDPTQPCT